MPPIFSITIFPETCESGRYYFGNMISTYADKIHLQGFYTRTVITYLGRTVFQLQSPEPRETPAPPVYLYFYESGMNMTSYWVIGYTIGEINGEYSIVSSSEEPETDQAGWYVRTSSEWQREQSMRLVCVSELSDVCKTGTVRMSGALEINKVEWDCMGVYHLINETHQLRPIYKHEERQVNISPKKTSSKDAAMFDSANSMLTPGCNIKLMFSCAICYCMFLL